MRSPLGDAGAAWCAAHHLRPRWLAAVLASWACHGVFAAVSIPLDYPYEERGHVIDTLVVVGMVLPLAVVAVALDEGPDELVRGAARSLVLCRLGLAAAYLAVVLGMAAVVAIVAVLPLFLVIIDAAFLASLTLLGAGVLGAERAWIPAAVVAVVVSAPGLLPWSLNVMYHVEVSRSFGVGVGVTAVVAVTIYSVRGSVRRRH